MIILNESSKPNLKDNDYVVCALGDSPTYAEILHVHKIDRLYVYGTKYLDFKEYSVSIKDILYVAKSRDDAERWIIRNKYIDPNGMIRRSDIPKIKNSN